MKQESFFRSAWRKLLQNKLATICFVVVIIELLLVIGAPLFAAVATPEQLKTYQERIANAKNDLQRADAQANIDIYGGDDPQSFAEIVTRVKAAFAKHNYTNDRYAVQKACQIACWGY